MYKVIMVAFDCPANSSAALKQGADLARLCKAELHVLGVIAPVGGVLFGLPSGSMDILGMERQYLAGALETAFREVGGQDLEMTTIIRDDDPATEIITYAHEMGVDLVVLGHSDKGFLARWLQGSTGSALMSDLPCSLLIAWKAE